MQASRSNITPFQSSIHFQIVECLLMSALLTSTLAKNQSENRYDQETLHIKDTNIFLQTYSIEVFSSYFKIFYESVPQLPKLYG